MSFTPKHLQVLPQLEREVERTLSGSRLPPIRTLMEKYQVSQSVIERSLDELTRRGLIFRKRGSGIYVNDAPNKAKVIGVYTDSEIPPHSTALFLAGVRQSAEQAGFQTADFGPRNIFENSDTVLDAAEKMNLAGIIAELSTATYFQMQSERPLNRLRELHLPIVTCPPLPGVWADSVMVDNFAIYKEVGATYRRRGKRHVKFLGHLGVPSLARLQGFIVGCGGGIDIDIELLPRPQANAFDRVKALVAEGWAGDLIISVPPHLPSELDALRESPWTVDHPSDLAVLLEEGDRLPPHLSAHVVLKQTRALGETAAQLLLHRIRGGKGNLITRNVAHRFLLAGNEPPPTPAFLPPTAGLRPKG